VRQASVQAVRLGLDGIERGVVRLTGGGYRAVLEVAGVGNVLDDTGRQEAALAGYAAFLNALSYPVQILVRAVPVDLGRYVGELEERARGSLPPELAAMARDHAAFVHGLSRERTLLERRFYIVVPAEQHRRRGWRESVVTGLSREVVMDAARRQLAFRCDEVIRQLGRCGLIARRLDDLELAHLALACWSPERARVQRFRQHLNDYTTLAVRAAYGAGATNGVEPGSKAGASV
jgi:hypothetical protein